MSTRRCVLLRYDRRAQRAYLGEYLGRTASPGDTWACGLRRHLSPRRIVARATWRGHVEGAPGVATWLAVQSCHVAGGAAAIYLTKCRRAAPMGKLHIRPVGHDCERPRRDHAEIHPRCVIEIHPRYTSEIHPRYKPRYTRDISRDPPEIQPRWRACQSDRAGPSSYGTRPDRRSCSCK